MNAAWWVRHSGVVLDLTKGQANLESKSPEKVSSEQLTPTRTCHRSMVASRSRSRGWGYVDDVCRTHRVISSPFASVQTGHVRYSATHLFSHSSLRRTLVSTRSGSAVDAKSQDVELKKEVGSLTEEVAQLQRFAQEYMVKAASEKLKVMNQPSYPDAHQGSAS